MGGGGLEGGEGKIRPGSDVADSNQMLRLVTGYRSHRLTDTWIFFRLFFFRGGFRKDVEDLCR